MSFESHDCGAQASDFELRSLTSPWSQGTVRWADAPALGARVDTGSVDELMDPTCSEGRIPWSYDISAYASEVFAGTEPYNGIALVATDEYATDVVSFTAADPAQPTTTGGIIDVWYRDSAGPRPARSSGGTRADRGARHSQPDAGGLL